MIYGIESTTDMRYPETRIEKFASEAQARTWLAKPSDFAWAGSARADLPSQQQNWHHRLREAWRMPAGWRPPSKRETERRLGPMHLRSTTYRRGHLDVVAAAIRADGEALRLDVNRSNNP